MSGRSLRCFLYRGGTSKGVLIEQAELPAEADERDRCILALFGSPHVRQIDGLGGADPLTSKLAILRPGSPGEGLDLHYMFGQVSIAETFVDYSGNCGNLSSAVGLYALDAGYVRLRNDHTVARVLNTNTHKILEAEIFPQGDPEVSERDLKDWGLSLSGALVRVNFLEPGGSKTGRLLPTGKVREEIVLEDGSRYEVTLADASNPAVLVRAADLGMEGTESPAEIDQDQPRLKILLEIRARAAERLGFVKDWRLAATQSAAIPKVACVAPPASYRALDGSPVDAGRYDLLARTLSMGRAHKAYAITGGIATAVAARLEGSVAWECLAESGRRGARVRLGHPSGILPIDLDLSRSGSEWLVRKAGIVRTARRLMEGIAYLP